MSPDNYLRSFTVKKRENSMVSGGGSRVKLFPSDWRNKGGYGRVCPQVALILKGEIDTAAKPSLRDAHLLPEQYSLEKSKSSSRM